MRGRDLGALREKVARLWPHLDERGRRLFAAGEAREVGHGGISLMSRLCGVSRVTITKGLRELDEPPLPAGRVRRPGAGRPRVEVRDPEVMEQLDALVEPLSRGDPESPLRWTSKSTRVLAGELTAADHPVSHDKVGHLLKAMDYSLQGTRKTVEGSQHPDRDAQFRFINEEVRKALRAKRPVISVDTKKKELIGNCENKGRTWRRATGPSPSTRPPSSTRPTESNPSASSSVACSGSSARGALLLDQTPAFDPSGAEPQPELPPLRSGEPAGYRLRSTTRYSARTGSSSTSPCPPRSRTEPDSSLPQRAPRRATRRPSRHRGDPLRHLLPFSAPPLQATPSTTPTPPRLHLVGSAAYLAFQSHTALERPIRPDPTFTGPF